MIRFALNTVNRSKYSETFIQDHYLGIEAEDRHFLHGGYMPIYANEELLLNRQPWMSMPNAIYKLAKRSNRKAIAEYLKLHEINIVLSEYGPCGVEMMAICQELNIPQLVYFHGYDITRSDMVAKWAKAYGQLVEQAAAVFSVSRDMSQKLEGIGCPANKIVYNPCGVDPEQFYPPIDGVKEAKFLFVGRFAETKSPLGAIRAFGKVHQEHPKARLRMIGDGPLLHSAKMLCKKLGIQDSVSLDGIQDRVQVAKAMRSSSCLLLPSITTHLGETEGTPVVLTEAMASGLAVIASRHAGIKDVIQHEQTGFLFEENDQREMETWMKELAADPSKARRTGLAAREWVKQNLTQAHTAAKITAVMHSVLAGNFN